MRGLPALLLAAAAVPLAAGDGSALVQPAAPSGHRQAVVLLLDDVAFEELLAVPQFRQLARAGGAGLMTTNTGAERGEHEAYLAVGAGSVGSAARREERIGGVLEENGISPCLWARPSREMTPVADALGMDTPRSECELGDVRGSDSLIVLPAPVEVHGRQPGASTGGAGERVEALQAAGLALREAAERIGGRRMLVLAAAVSPSPSMERVGDEVAPVVLAYGNATALFPEAGRLRALTSGSTRQEGLVANVDLAPTILDFFGVPIPARMDGQPIQVVGAPAPFGLHRRHLEQRRVRFPIQMAQLAFVSFAGLIAIGALLMHARRPLSARPSALMRILALCGMGLPIAVLAAGLLPRLTYPWIVPFIVAAVLAVVSASVFAGRLGVPAPVAIAAIGLALVVADAALGGRALRTPLFGGTMFDGVRFYGLPNAFIPLVLASGLFLAAPLSPVPGTLLLIAAALFSGLPGLGANVGASATLFAAAGLWWGIRTRGRLALRELAFAAGLTSVGLAVVLFSHRWVAQTPTHATRFADGTRGGVGSVLEAVGRRLSVGFDQLLGAPAALIPLAGLVVLLWAFAVRPGAVAGVFVRYPVWRDVLVVLVLSSAVAYLANDTGVAASAPSFLYAMSLVTYLTFSPQSHLARAVESPRPSVPARAGSGARR